jgi:hypothetical protein
VAIHGGVVHRCAIICICRSETDIITYLVQHPHVMMMMMMMMMMVYYCLSKKTPLLNTHTFTPVESELNTLSAALAASKPLLAGTDP